MDRLAVAFAVLQLGIFLACVAAFVKSGGDSEWFTPMVISGGFLGLQTALLLNL